jgi:hypothetical protein
LKTNFVRSAGHPLEPMKQVHLKKWKDYLHQSFHKYTNLGRMWSDQNRRM